MPNIRSVRISIDPDYSRACSIAAGWVTSSRRGEAGWRISPTAEFVRISQRPRQDRPNSLSYRKSVEVVFNPMLPRFGLASQRPIFPRKENDPVLMPTRRRGISFRSGVRRVANWDRVRGVQIVLAGNADRGKQRLPAGHAAPMRCSASVSFLAQNRPIGGYPTPPMNESAAWVGRAL